MHAGPSPNHTPNSQYIKFRSSFSPYFCVLHFSHAHSFPFLPLFPSLLSPSVPPSPLSLSPSFSPSLSLFLPFSLPPSLPTFPFSFLSPFHPLFLPPSVPFSLCYRIDHWDLEKERVLLLTDNNLISVRYNFIQSLVEELKFIPLAAMTDVIFGDFKYTSSVI